MSRLLKELEKYGDFEVQMTKAGGLEIYQIKRGEVTVPFVDHPMWDACFVEAAKLLAEAIAMFEARQAIGGGG
jgi:hypothetical protein